MMNPLSVRLADLQLHLEDLDCQLSIVADDSEEWDESRSGDLLIRRADIDYEIRAITGEEYQYKCPTLEQCIKAIGPTNKWVANCYGVANELLKKLKLPGKLQYGFYNGPVDEKSPLAKRGMQRHAWILLKDGRIFDPTRWGFDSPKLPYIFVCEDIRDEYDFGMNQFR